MRIPFFLCTLHYHEYRSSDVSSDIVTTDIIFTTDKLIN